MSKALFFRLHQQGHRCFFCGCDLSARDAEIGLACASVSPSPGVTAISAALERSVAVCGICMPLYNQTRWSAADRARVAVLSDGVSCAEVDQHYQEILRLSLDLRKAAELFHLT